MVGALGAEVDRLETEIQQLMPGIRHIDLVRPPPSCYCAWCGPRSLLWLFFTSCPLCFLFHTSCSVVWYCPGGAICKHMSFSLQETDRGRHDKGSAQRHPFYSVAVDPARCPPSTEMV